MKLFESKESGITSFLLMTVWYTGHMSAAAVLTWLLCSRHFSAPWHASSNLPRSSQAGFVSILSEQITLHRTGLIMLLNLLPLNGELPTWWKSIHSGFRISKRWH